MSKFREWSDPRNLIPEKFNPLKVPRINAKLDKWRDAWNKLRLPTTKRSPFRLWVSGQLLNPVGIELSDLDIDMYATEGIVDNSINEGDRPIFEAPNVISEECQRELYEHIPEQWSSDNYGIDIYCGALRTNEQ